MRWHQFIDIVLSPFPSRMKESRLWISEDAGVTWTSHLTPFRLDGAVSFHPFEPKLLLAYSRSHNFSVYLSEDFGKNWKKVQVGENRRGIDFKREHVEGVRLEIWRDTVASRHSSGQWNL